ncbi:MAG: phage resistance protein, partial [Planctomycetales bacterium]|nr:phage resistance protein [Planctomycetales bacterium]
ISPGSLDPTHNLELNEHYTSLWPGFAPQPPVAANLAGAMQHLLGQALEHEFPAAPLFETEAKPSVLKKVCEEVLPATQVADGRLAIDKTKRPIVRQVAGPLRLGEMGIDATHFVLGQHWKTHFTRKAAETGSDLTVRQLRKWMDDPKPMGLPKDAQNLVILVYAAQSNLTLHLHGAPYDATLSSVPDACELRPVDLPPAPDWEVALHRAGTIFGVAGLKLLSAGNVAKLSSECRHKASEVRRACEGYAQRLQQRMVELGMTPHVTDRMKTAVAAQLLTNKLSSAEPKAIVATLASATIETSETAMGECVGKAAELEGNLDTAGWETFEVLRKLPEAHQSTAHGILLELEQTHSSY